MARMENGKIRLLAVERIILRKKKVTIAEIQRELELRYDISADRKTIMDDIYAIDRFAPIEASVGPRGGYQLVDALGRCNAVNR